MMFKTINRYQFDFRADLRRMPHFLPCVFILLMPLFAIAQSNLQPARYQVVEAQVGVRYYLDRAYTIAGMPIFLNGTVLIQPANNDKLNGTITFEVNKRSDLWIAHDPRNTPAWLQSYQKLPDILSISGDPGITYYDLYYGKIDSGTLTLGPNNAQSMFFCFVHVPPDTLTGSRIIASWIDPNDEPVTFRVYWSREAKQTAALADTIQFADGIFTLQVSAVDSVGNESALAPKPPITAYFRNIGTIPLPDTTAALPPLVNARADTVDVETHGRPVIINIKNK